MSTKGWLVGRGVFEAIERRWEHYRCNRPQGPACNSIVEEIVSEAHQVFARLPKGEYDPPEERRYCSYSPLLRAVTRETCRKWPKHRLRPRVITLHQGRQGDLIDKIEQAWRKYLMLSRWMLPDLCCMNTRSSSQPELVGLVREQLRSLGSYQADGLIVAGSFSMFHTGALYVERLTTRQYGDVYWEGLVHCDFVGLLQPYYRDRVSRWHTIVFEG